MPCRIQAMRLQAVKLQAMKLQAVRLQTMKLQVMKGAAPMDTVKVSASVEGEKITYKDSTYEIVSKIAFLIGIHKRIFEKEPDRTKLDVYNTLMEDKNARIIRNLCVVRTSIMRYYKHINNKMKLHYATLLSIPEYIPTESMEGLAEDGIFFMKKSSVKLYQHIMEINRILSDRINNCKSLFPMWLDWQYVRDLFIMPNGLTEEGVKTAIGVYYGGLLYYPYQVYINWTPKDEGNILYNDKKFATLLYRWHDDIFTEYSKVSDAGSFIKGNIYDYINESEKVVVVVDCENSDPYKLCATLKNLDSAYTSKISQILLFDDVHTATAWQILENFTDIPVEHTMIERVKQSKSLVDIKLTARACQEHYQNHVDSFVIVSSDSDYWGLISSLPQARFLVMVESEKCGPDMKRALIDSGIFFCYIDDFYTGNSEDIKMGALFREMRRYIDGCFHLNGNDILNEALRATRVEMPPAERKQFYDKYIKSMQLVIGPDGEFSIDFKKK